MDKVSNMQEQMDYISEKKKMEMLRAKINMIDQKQHNRYER